MEHKDMEEIGDKLEALSDGLVKIEFRRLFQMDD